MKRHPKTSNGQLEFMWGEPESTQEITRECEYGLSLGGRPANLGPPLTDDDKALMREMVTSNCSMEEFMSRYAGVAVSNIRYRNLGGVDSGRLADVYPNTGIGDGDGNVMICMGSESIANPVASTLSDILEDDESRLEKYYLRPEQLKKMFGRLKRNMDRFGVKAPSPEILEAMGMKLLDNGEFVPANPTSD